jgi:hypothetical protein
LAIVKLLVELADDFPVGDDDVRLAPGLAVL